MATQVQPLDERLSALFASDPVAMADPFSLYRELREQGPVHDFGSVVLISPYAEVKAIFRDAEGFSSQGYRTGTFAQANRARLTVEQQAAFDELARLDSMRMSATDGEVHDRLRAIAHRAFTPARIREFEESVYRYMDELLAPYEGQEVVDLMAMAYRLPLLLVCDLLGVPHADGEQIHAWSDVIGRNRGGSDPETVLPGFQAVQEFHAYVNGLIERHWSDEAPSHLVAALMDASHDDQMSIEEAVVTYMMLLFAGHETTTNLISIGMTDLLQRPEQWQLLVDDPSLAANATEELLRFTTPVQWNNRVPVTDVEIGGLTIEAGRTIRLMTSGANRDPDVFDDPDEVDITRSNARDQLALGFGQHFCLGNQLARLEGKAAFQTLAERYPNMELATDELEWTGSSALRRVARVPVRLNA